MLKRLFHPSLFLAAALLLSGCSGLLPAVQSSPLPPEMIGTEIVQTQTAIAFETALNAPPPTETPRPSRTPRPSETARPTYTPSLTPSPTVTFVITIPSIRIIPSPTTQISYPYSPLPGYQAANGCDLVAQSPKLGAVYAPGTKFDAYFTFANYGPYYWNEHEVDFSYVSGDKIMRPNNVLVYDIPINVAPKERVTMELDMLAPDKAGSYSMAWKFAQGDRFFCQVTVSIVVKVP